MKVRTYERGVEGETFACGTGAVAVGVVLTAKNLTGDTVHIQTKGGEILNVYINEEVYLEGSAHVIYAADLWKEATE